jgi:hypothetical protein
VLAAVDAGTVERSDEEQVEYPTGRGLVLCTSNQRDFHRIHTQWLAAGRSHAGIICIRQQGYSVGEQVRRLSRVVSTLSADSMRDRMEWLSAWG